MNSTSEKKKVLRRVRRASEQAKIAKESRDGWIHEALELCSVREVATAAELSPARVHQIRHGK